MCVEHEVNTPITGCVLIEDFTQHVDTGLCARQEGSGAVMQPGYARRSGMEMGSRRGELCGTIIRALLPSRLKHYHSNQHTNTDFLTINGTWGGVGE